MVRPAHTAVASRKVARSSERGAVAASQSATRAGPINAPVGTSAASASEPSVNSATGSHHERRRAAVHGPRVVAITTQNHAAAATSSAARTSSIQPDALWRSLLAARMYASVCRWTIVRQPDCAALGRIHPDKVMALVRFSDGDAGTLTTAASPSNRSASPYRPGAQVRASDLAGVVVSGGVRGGRAGSGVERVSRHEAGGRRDGRRHVAAYLVLRKGRGRRRGPRRSGPESARRREGCRRSTVGSEASGSCPCVARLETRRPLTYSRSVAPS